jgi:two-component sensor histidine kinase
LRQIRRAALKFARGDNDARVGDLGSAPIRIAEVARSFDLMADKISDREDKLKDNLAEKEAMMREIHHRVKNNLQIVISLLNMQERRLREEDAVAKTAIQDARSRINAVALVHRGLYEGEDLRYIEMAPFLGRLIEHTHQTISLSPEHVKLYRSIECKNLEADQAIPVALFVVEALTNALKHGVPKGGDVIISMSETDGQVQVTIEDNGGGLPKNSVLGTGRKLIDGFARQLSGKINYPECQTGHAVQLVFAA